MRDENPVMTFPQSRKELILNCLLPALYLQQGACKNKGLNKKGKFVGSEEL